MLNYCHISKYRIYQCAHQSITLRAFLLLHICYQNYIKITLYSQCLHRLPGGWFNIKMLSYQYRKSHCGDKMILRPSYLHNGISYAGKMTSLYWISAQVLQIRYDITAHSLKSWSEVFSTYWHSVSKFRLTLQWPFSDNSYYDIKNNIMSPKIAGLAGIICVFQYIANTFIQILNIRKNNLCKHNNLMKLDIQYNKVSCSMVYTSQCKFYAIRWYIYYWWILIHTYWETTCPVLLATPLMILVVTQ